MGVFTYNLLTFFLVIVFVLGFVTIVMWFKKKEGERKTSLLMASLEKGQTIDPSLLHSGKSADMLNKYILLALLICGTGISIFAAIASVVVVIEEVQTGSFNNDGTMASIVLIAIGASLLLGYFKAKKMLAPEHEADEK